MLINEISSVINEQYNKSMHDASAQEFFQSLVMVANIAKSGFFSSDRTIKEYNEDIWKI